MTHNAESIIDRRRLRRKLTFWRIAFLALVAIGIIGFSYISRQSASFSSPHVAKIRITGTITENIELLERLSAIEKNDAVKGLIMIVDSPGGTTVGGESIFNAVRRIAEKKPVVTSVGTLSASAGYMIASASDHIVAYETSIIGSIGVLFQYPDISVLLDKIGVKVETIKSTPLKAEPNYFTPASDEAKAMIRSMILDSYDWFVDLVAKRRNLSHEDALKLADGAVYTGRQALSKKLIDQLGGEIEARKWLNGKGLEENLPVLEWKEKSNESLFSPQDLIIRMAAQMLGLPVETNSALTELGKQRIFLDGMVSVMQFED